MPEFALSMARGAIIYQKMLPILSCTQILARACVSLKAELAPAFKHGAFARDWPTGHLTTYDIRQDALNRARKT